MFNRVAALLAAFVFAPAVNAASDAAAKFGVRETVQGIALSPNGDKIAILSPTQGRGMALLVGRLSADGELKPILSSTGNPDRLRECNWSTNERLVCSIYMIVPQDGDLLGYSRMLAINADGSGMKELSRKAGSRDLRAAQEGGDIIDWLPAGDGSAVLMTRTYVPEETVGSIIARRQSGLGVDRVDTVTQKSASVVPPRETAEEYITDGRGTVRIVGLRPRLSSGYDGSQIVYNYRKAGQNEWLPLSSYDVNKGSGFNPYAVDPTLDVVYGFEKANGRLALYRIALDGTLRKELVYSNPSVDLSGLIQVGRQQRVVGTTYSTEKSHAEFFDPELKALSKSLSKAIPGLPIIRFVDASADEKKLLLFAGSDVEPGRYYLYDKATHQLGEVAPSRPELAGVKLAEVKAISFPAADGTPIPAYLTLPPGSDGKGIPAIVMPHGGPWSRDEWGFDWLAQFFANRGFAVLQPNFRGSAGYGDEWFQQNGFKSWRTAVGDVNDGGRYLIKQGIARPDKLAIVGWSYGGYAALQSAVLDPDLFKAIVAIAPVTDLDKLREESRNFMNFKIVDAAIGTGPHVREGSPAQNAARIHAPVLMFHGELDQNVGVGESRFMLSRLKEAGGKGELVVYPDLDHQLEDSKVRTEMLDRADVFLRGALGLGL